MALTHRSLQRQAQLLRRMVPISPTLDASQKRTSLSHRLRHKSTEYATEQTTEKAAVQQSPQDAAQKGATEAAQHAAQEATEEAAEKAARAAGAAAAAEDTAEDAGDEAEDGAEERADCVLLGRAREPGRALAGGPARGGEGRDVDVATLGRRSGWVSIFQSMSANA